MDFKELIISKNISAIDAMRRLDEAGCRILFIAESGKLQGVLTDSDIRKYILRGGDLASSVEKVANFSPKSLHLNERKNAQDFMMENYIDAVPLLDDEGNIIDVVFANQKVGDAKENARLDIPVVVMAGGLGTRLYPYTKILPKPLIPIGENPIIEHVLGKFLDFGCGQFHLLVNYRKNMLKSYFADLENPYDISWVDEDKPLGTGGGLSLLKGKLSEAFFLTNCDTLIEADYADIAKMHKEQKNTITMVCATKQYTIPYGVVELSESGEYTHIKEKPCMNFLTNTGMYLVEPNVLDEIEDDVAQGFPDIIETCKKQGMRIGIYPIGEAMFMDMGQIEELDEMRRRFEGA